MDDSAVAERIAVIGVGNDYRHDDGVGWAVVAGLVQRGKRRPLPHGTRLTRTDGDPTRVIGAWDGVRLAIVVDAARSHPGRPGHVHRLRLDGALSQPPRAVTSSHGFPLEDTVRLAHALDRMPGDLLVYAVEAADTSLGSGLSPQVAAAVGPLVHRIEGDIVRHVLGGR
ncbi:hydrogenase maturation protease [Streptomyces gilvosporeus]|uniref:Peptidase M52 n=1 Tax=Streptomyces gilvosporeus TaxID=553510 RepID=A0A1V0TKC8_9ACTN|nr:hydrogenase maturation protease [Streptomyces gilvosporeus]ARF53369.1 peptidase M52 [Streptomyces gilvosporeus]